MTLQKKLKICSKCGTQFNPDPDDPQSDSCYLCDHQPEDPHKTNAIMESADTIVFPHLTGPGAPTISENLQGQGFTGRLTGAHHNGSKPHRTYIYKDKVCETCHKTFSPSGALKRNCPRCDKPISKNRVTRNNAAQRERKLKEFNISQEAWTAVHKMSKSLGLTPSTLILEALKVLEKSWIPLDAQIKTHR